MEDVVRAWVAGWAVSRGTPAPVDEGGWLRVDVGRPKESVRRVVLHADALDVALAAATEPLACVKVAGGPELRWTHFGPAWEDEGRQWLMTLRLTDGAPAPPPEGYRLVLENNENVVLARVLASEGEVAAQAQIGLAGSDAVVDQVSTSEQHRRRGLGSAVMTALQAEALTRGATRAVLCASPDGRELYRRLGWDEISPVTAGYRTQDGGSANPVR